jgi:hypothetical protein
MQVCVKTAPKYISSSGGLKDLRPTWSLLTKASEKLSILILKRGGGLGNRGSIRDREE